MKIEIIGTGCAKCDALERATRAAADRLGLHYEIQHVKDIREFAKRGVMFTPALVVNGKVLVSGRLPDDAELTRLLQQAGQQPQADRPQ